MVVLPRWHCKVERGVRYSYSGLEILHGGVGGDVELGARTSEHILVFAFDPLVSLTLSLFNLCIASYLFACVLALIHIAIHYILGLIVCASLVLNHKSFI